MKRVVSFVLTFAVIIGFNACTKNTWTDEEKKGVMLQQAQFVSIYMSNYEGQKLDNNKSDELIKVTTCLVDLYTNEYNSYGDYFNQLPTNNSKNSIDRNKKKILLENLLSGVAT